MEGRFRQREQTDREEGPGKGSRLTEGEVQVKGADRPPEGRFRQREQTDRGKAKAKGAG